MGLMHVLPLLVGKRCATRLLGCLFISLYFVQVATHDRKGDRLQYYADDDPNKSVREMMEHEKLGLEEVSRIKKF